MTNQSLTSVLLYCLCEQEASVSVDSPAMTSIDILGGLVEFVPETQFLFFAPVSRSWKTAWGRRSTCTSIHVVAYTLGAAFRGRLSRYVGR